MDILFSATVRTLTDVAFLFIVSYCLARKKMLIKFSHIMSALGFMLVLGTVRYFSNSYVFFLLAFFFAGILLLKMIHGYRFSKTLLMGVVIFTIRIMLEIPFYFTTLLDLNRMLLIPLTQIAKLVITVVICKQFKLYKLFHVMQRNVLPNLILRQMILTLAFTLLAYMILVNPSERDIVFLFYFYFTILIVGLSLIPTTKRLYQKSVQEMISIHELHNALLSTGIAIRQVNEVDEAIAKFDELSKRFGIDLSHVDFNNKTVDGMNDQITAFIDLKQAQHKVKTEVIAEVGYYKDHQHIDLQQILHWLGTLLDNALDASIKQPIKVRLIVTSSRISLSVTNDYMKDTVSNFELLFEEGHSTKGEGRGLGLYHLKQTVSEKGGRITCFEEEDTSNDDHYLTITIEFKQKNHSN